MKDTGDGKFNYSRRKSVRRNQPLISADVLQSPFLHPFDLHLAVLGYRYYFTVVVVYHKTIVANGHGDLNEKKLRYTH